MRMPGPVALVAVGGALLAGTGRAAEAGFRWHEQRHIEWEGSEIACLQGALAGTVTIDVVPGKGEIHCNLPNQTKTGATETTPTSLMPHVRIEPVIEETPPKKFSSVQTNRQDLETASAALKAQKDLDERTKDKWGSFIRDGITFGPGALVMGIRMFLPRWRRLGELEAVVPQTIDEVA